MPSVTARATSLTPPSPTPTPTPTPTLSPTLTFEQALQYLLLDHHGGLADLRARVLRSPMPAHTPLEGVWREVIATRTLTLTEP